MRLTIIAPDNVYTHDVDPSMNVEDVQALIEAEIGLPTNAQLLSSDAGIPLTEGGRSLESYNLSSGEETIYLTFKTPPQRSTPSSNSASGSRQNPNNLSTLAGGSSSNSASSSAIDAEFERMRLQVLGDPAAMANLRSSNPAMAEAVQMSAQAFRQAMEHAQRNAAAEKERQIELLNADPYDIEAQKKIEEAIRMEAVLENMQHAMEYSPEAFASVTMLYINVEVNGHKVKAFVDSGAQSTIISTSCAEACGIMRLIDTRYGGTAVGVGTAQILGRIHSTQIKLGDLFLPVSFSVLDTTGVDLLFGLDMLKRHQACIDLATNTLRIGTASISFLPEHELPESSKHKFVDELSEELGPAKGSGAHSVPAPAGSSTGAFPGSGHSLGGGSGAGAGAVSGSSFGAGGGVASGSGSGSRSGVLESGTTGGGGRSSGGSGGTGSPKEEDIQTLVNLGAPRDHAVQLLEAAGGDVDVAASMLFG